MLNDGSTTCLWCLHSTGLSRRSCSDQAASMVQGNWLGELEEVESRVHSDGGPRRGYLELWHCSSEFFFAIHQRIIQFAGQRPNGQTERAWTAQPCLLRIHLPPLLRHRPRWVPFTPTGTSKIFASASGERHLRWVGLRGRFFISHLKSLKHNSSTSPVTHFFSNSPLLLSVMISLRFETSPRLHPNATTTFLRFSAQLLFLKRPCKS